MRNTRLITESSHESLQRASNTIAKIIFGKQRQIQLAITCLLAGGHLLIEDLPGVGKTTLSLAIAKTFGLKFKRIQFTSDMLPADVLGISIFDSNKQIFNFHPGPIFTQTLLADEINRATPKTQSALLEAMEEHQITQDGETRALPEPFFVIATQNPTEQVGTYPLPESQLDRFLMRIEIGYPDQKSERLLLENPDRRQDLENIIEIISGDELLSLQNSIKQVHVSKAILDYLLALIRSSRLSPWFSIGLSPRAGLALQRCAQAWAFLHNRDHVLPEDVQQIMPSVAAHRLQVNPLHQDEPIDNLIINLIKQVPV